MGPGCDVGRLVRMVAAGFIAGFLATPVFHQPVLAVLHVLSVTDRKVYNFDPIPPVGVPALLSLSFWGGVWGIALAAAQDRFGRHHGDLGFAVLFGAIGPTLGTWFVSAPMHGRGLGGGWYAGEMLTSILVNGAWGIGTTLVLRRFLAAGLRRHL